MAFRTDAPDLPLYTLHWEHTGTDLNPTSRMLAHMRIGGLDMHLEAIEVDGTESQGAAEEIYFDRLDTLQSLEETTFETITISGREYVLFAVPYGE